MIQSVRLSPCRAVIAGSVLAFVATARAGTTKGLNQIVTPDIQIPGQFSMSLQYQNPAIGNSLMDQLELGITKNFEVALFNGFKPGTQYVAMELGLIQSNDWLLSTGYLNWSTRGGPPQPFLEGGYYKGNTHLMAGAQRVGNQTLAIAGASYQLTGNFQLMSDFISGRANFSTFGFTYNITKALSINPALYVSNGPGHKLYPYAVLTWTVTAWKPGGKAKS